MRSLEAGVFANCRTVHLTGSSITDAGLDSLKSMSKLEELDLANTAVTDAGLVKLQGLTQLRRLRLLDTKITDDGIENLKALKNLEDLDLGNTQGNSQIGDAGLAKLKGLDNLQILNLSGTQVTDDGLKSLKDLPKLRQVQTARTAVTEAGEKDLEAELAQHPQPRRGGPGAEGNHLRNAMDLCREYTVLKKKPPSQIDEVKEWAIKEKKASEDDFVSTRDQQPYGVVSMPMGNQVVVYEQAGKGGKRFMSIMDKVVELPSAEVDDKIQGFSGNRTGKPKK
jgi:hypothetical protein